jgi:hypothetical protein
MIIGGELFMDTQTSQYDETKAAEVQKAPYSPPRLVRYGDLASITDRGMSGLDGNKQSI